MMLLGDDPDPLQRAINSLVALMMGADTLRDGAKAPWAAPRWAVPSVCYTCGHRRAFRGDPLVLPGVRRGHRCMCDRRRGERRLAEDPGKRPVRP